jgi:hypothetical protein
VFRKLGIRSRAQLAVHIALQAAGSPKPAEVSRQHRDASVCDGSSFDSVGISPIETVNLTCNHSDCTRCSAGSDLRSQ